MAQFCTKVAVMSNCVIVDIKLATPEQLKRWILARLDRSHQCQEAKISALSGSGGISWIGKLLKPARRYANAICLVRI